MTIFKTKLDVCDYQTVELPQDYKIIHVAMQQNTPCIWYECTPDMPLVTGEGGNPLLRHGLQDARPWHSRRSHRAHRLGSHPRRLLRLALLPQVLTTTNKKTIWKNHYLE